MGEWSDYFEDFPEENPGNWVNGRYVGPDEAREMRLRQALSQGRAEIAGAKRDFAQAKLDAEIAAAIAKGEQRRLEKAGRG